LGWGEREGSDPRPGSGTPLAYCAFRVLVNSVILEGLRNQRPLLLPKWTPSASDTAEGRDGGWEIRAEVGMGKRHSSSHAQLSSALTFTISLAAIVDVLLRRKQT
jgi:hypothetical protein